MNKKLKPKIKIYNSKGKLVRNKHTKEIEVKHNKKEKIKEFLENFLCNMADVGTFRGY